MKNIVVAGAGYVGLSIATLLSIKENVTIIDTNEEKIKKLQNFESPIEDEFIEKFFGWCKSGELRLNLHATMDNTVYRNADYVIIAVPTNYDEATKYFDCHFIEDVIDTVRPLNENCVFVIKSTIPIGYCDYLYYLYNKYNKEDKRFKLMFSPEFLRESKALYDNLYPSRIIVGAPDWLKSSQEEFADMLRQCSLKENDVKVLLMGLKEAESVKLFANTYLAMRVAYFNELDTFCEMNNINSESVINGVSSDKRIGEDYNNPSFGYGGYCFPKDTKQMLANFNNKNIPQNLIKSIIDSNETRKDFIVDTICKNLEKFNINEDQPLKIGIYRLIMKSNSDNFRSSAVIDIINKFKSRGIQVYIYEPKADVSKYPEFDFINDLSKFKEISNIILANRITDDLRDCINKVYSRDIYHNN